MGAEPAAAPAPTREQVLRSLAKWQDYGGLTPFGNADSRHATDRCNAYLGNAGSILSMLSAACADAATLRGKGTDSEFDGRSHIVLQGALDGIGDLIDLAAFMLDDD